MDDDEGTVTKYIEAVDGVHFAIKIKVTKDATFKGSGLGFYTAVDGSSIRNPFVEPRHVKSGPRIRIVEGMQVGAQSMRKLRFNALETGESIDVFGT